MPETALISVEREDYVRDEDVSTLSNTQIFLSSSYYFNVAL